MTIANVCKNAEVMIVAAFFLNANWVVMTITDLDRF